MTGASNLHRQAGATLAEMVLVMAVLAIAAGIAIPPADTQAALGADAAAGEIARAVRFAQREAVRTGTYQTVVINTASQMLRVYQPASSGNGTTATHPVDKRDYLVNFANDSLPQATIVSSVFRYQSGAVTNGAIFGPDGVPVDVAPSKFLGLPIGIVLGTKEISPLKEEARITLRYGSVERVVRVAPVTGRVSL
ncbi:MAG: hypothetical protein AB1807_06895 [Pseudomonadota bacterium]